MFSIKETANGVIFHIHVVPKSAKNEYVGTQGDAMKLKITAPPVEGQANDACVRFLSELLKVRKSQVTILSGHTSKKKTIAVGGIKKREVEALLPGVS